MWAICLFAGSVQAGAYDDILAATGNGDTAAVLDLVKRGMDVNTADPAGTTPSDDRGPQRQQTVD
jgi:hypothetical protein